MSETSDDSEGFVDAIDESIPPTSNNDPPTNPIDSFPLHRAVFENKPTSVLEEILTSSTSNKFISQKDIHGNTPLHLAVMLGHEDQINFLLQHNAPIKSKNLHGWTPLEEAVSYGDRKIIKIILRMARKQARQSWNERLPKLIETLTTLRDFQMELRWEFHSWIPFIKRFLPSDVCRISKKGANIRLDTTLLDFYERRWQRGNLTFLFNGAKKSSEALVIMDNELKVYQYLRYNAILDIDEDVDLLMSSDLMYFQLNHKSLTFSRAQTGWLFVRYNKTEKVGQYEADCYNINGLMLETRKRREHLSEEDVQSNKAIYKTLAKSLDAQEQQRIKDNKLSKRISSNSGSSGEGDHGRNSDSFDDILVATAPQTSDNGTNGVEMVDPEVFHESPSSPAKNSEDSYDDILTDTDNDGEPDDSDDENLADVKAVLVSATESPIKPRKSLPPPVKPNISWEDYIMAPKGSPPCLGRPWKIKETTKTFKASVAMSQEFPLTIESLLNILEVITQFKHFKKLKEFVSLNLPPGFPVKIDVPILPTILARATFLNFTFNEKLDEHLFEIPADYTEDPSRFPDLS